MNDPAPSQRSSLWLLPVVAIALGAIAGGALAIGSYREPQMLLAGNGNDVQLTDSDAIVRDNTGDPSSDESVGDATKEPSTDSGSGLLDIMPVSEKEQDPVGTPPEELEIKDAKPRAFLPLGNEHDFGVMARDDKQSYSFPVRNIGKGPLTLKVIGSTCKCTVGSLEDESIPSGETRPVTLTWEAKSYDREFRQSATIETNDRSVKQIVFSVYGQVVQLAMPDMPAVQFKVRRGEAKSFTTKIYGYRDDDLLITGHEFLKKDLAEFFDVRYQAIPKDQWEDRSATSAVLCTVDIKPGLPLGQVTQVMKLSTNKTDIAPLTVSIDMNVVSDISLFGARLSKNGSNILTLNHVDGAKGWEEPIQMIAKGEHSDKVKPSVASADPADVLTAEFGEPKEMKKMVDGVETVQARFIPMKVIVKKGSNAVSRMGNEQGDFGVITIKTNHPEVKEFDLRVRFLVKTRE